jgi:hypothetical protein
VELKFLCFGHSLLPCDSDFALTEKRKSICTKWMEKCDCWGKAEQSIYHKRAFDSKYFKDLQAMLKRVRSWKLQKQRGSNLSMMIHHLCMCKNLTLPLTASHVPWEGYFLVKNTRGSPCSAPIPFLLSHQLLQLSSVYFISVQFISSDEKRKRMILWKCVNTYLRTSESFITT